MHRQGRSPKGSGLFVFMGRAAEGRGSVVMRPFVRFRPAAGREGIPFFSRDPLHGPEPLRSLGGLLASAYLCTDWQPETVVMAGRAGLRAIGNRIPEGGVPLGIRTEDTVKNNGATMGREAVMIVLVFTIKGCKAHFYHRKSSKRDIPPEIIAKACIIR